MSILEFSVCKAFAKLQLSLESSLSAGKIIVVLGPSGSGKSSLLRMLAGLDRPDQGQIRFNENVWFDAAKKIDVTPQERHVGYVFQDYALFDHMSIEKNIGFGVDKSRREEVSRYWLNRLKLDDYAQSYPTSLSGGQKQRVALARALAANPQLLLLDEPLSAIDFSLRREIRRELKQTLKEWNKTTIIVTHDLEEARYFADELLLLDNGAVLQQGSVDDLFENPKSIRAAKILGWQNQLEVDSIRGELAQGHWGRLMLNRHGDSEQASLLFRDSDIELERVEDETGVAIVSSSTRNANATRLELKLTNNIHIDVLKHGEHVSFEEGASVDLKLTDYRLFRPS